jgi:transcriptional/translational regulatory protein YebC/TACO1
MVQNRKLEILSSGFERIPQVTKALTEAQVADVEKLLEKIEEDDDVQNVYHTMEEN